QRVQLLVHRGVDPGDEEGGHRVDRGQVYAGVPGTLETVDVGLRHRAVAVQREDQRDVHADALGGRRRDRRQALGGRRDLHQQVGPVDQLPQLTGLGGGGGGVVGEVGVDLDGDPTVDTVGAPVDVGEP